MSSALLAVHVPTIRNKQGAIPPDSPPHGPIPTDPLIASVLASMTPLVGAWTDKDIGPTGQTKDVR